MPDDSRLRDPVPPPCPICGRTGEISWRPFCSRRCADLDLGRWMTGAYAIPAGDDAPGTAETDER